VSAKPLEFQEAMRAEQVPDIYSGDDCDEHQPRWMAWSESDKDGPGEIEDIRLMPGSFPPGTVVRVMVPCCPQCGTSADLALDMGTASPEGIGSCGCGFDWKEWAGDRYS